MAKRRLRAYNATALYIHITPEMIRKLKTKLVMLQMPCVEMRLPCYRNQHKKSTKAIKIADDLWIEAKLMYPDLVKAGTYIEAYWSFNLTRRIPF